ncbi:co-chaperonin groeS [Caudoviricetes sp.]|nr:co-chaperonin groeS [Caudoviricetes sp.]
MSKKHGLKALEYKVIVHPVKVEERTKGGIVLPDIVVEKDQNSAMEGTIVDISPLAFTYAEWPADASKPAVGDKVIFSRYSGINVKGNDGLEYRIMNDKDIVAVRGAA